MRVDLRVKHDIEARKAAIGLFERGHGFKSAAKALSVPRNTVRQWLYVCRSFGSEVLLSMDGRQTRYTYEQKVAAASAVVDGGMSKQYAMKAFGVMSLAPLKRWCALYREGGAEALRPPSVAVSSPRFYRLLGRAHRDPHELRGGGGPHAVLRRRGGRARPSPCCTCEPPVRTAPRSNFLSALPSL